MVRLLNLSEVQLGSNGSGRISDYPGSSSSSGIGSGTGGDGGAIDRCSRAFNTRLEDVELSPYYQAHGVLPPIGTKVRVVQGKRMQVQTLDGEVIGNLPTSLNYLAACLKDGWTYVGTVQKLLSQQPVLTVALDFVALAAG